MTAVWEPVSVRRKKLASSPKTRRTHVALSEIPAGEFLSLVGLCTDAHNGCVSTKISRIYVDFHTCTHAVQHTFAVVDGICRANICDYLMTDKKYSVFLS